MNSEVPPAPWGVTSEHFTLDGLVCQRLRTLDDSFSLRYAEDHSDLTEPMHSSKGAWSETLTVYEPALALSLARHDHTTPWVVSSIGLGVGYNEILAAGLALKHRLGAGMMILHSYELKGELRDAFEAYFRPNSTQQIPTALAEIYQDICRRVADYLHIDLNELSTFMSTLVTRGWLVFREGISDALLDSLTESSFRSHCILFDAFSPASSPDLWDMRRLEKLIATLSAQQCVFASYASRTVLKHALRAAGFSLAHRRGFAGKRELTFAHRGAALPPV